MYYTNPIDLFTNVIKSIGFNVVGNNSNITAEVVGSWDNYIINIVYDHEFDSITLITPLPVGEAAPKQAGSFKADSNRIQEVVSMLNQELKIGYLISEDIYLNYVFQMPFIQHFEITSDLVEKTINLVSFICDSICPIIQAGLIDKNVDADRIRLLLTAPLGEV